MACVFQRVSSGLCPVSSVVCPRVHVLCLLSCVLRCLSCVFCRVSYGLCPVSTRCINKAREKSIPTIPSLDKTATTTSTILSSIPSQGLFMNNFRLTSELVHSELESPIFVEHSSCHWSGYRLSEY